LPKAKITQKPSSINHKKDKRKASQMKTNQTQSNIRGKKLKATSIRLEGQKEVHKVNIRGPANIEPATKRKRSTKPRNKLNGNREIYVDPVVR